MTRAKKTVVIVDAFSSGRLLPELFRERGYTPIHLRSRPDVPAHYTALYPGDTAFEATYVLNDGEPDEDIVRAIRAHNPVSLVCGSESGATTHDRISEFLHLPGNASETTGWRTDKFLMQERLREMGLPHILQRRITQSHEAINFAQRESGWPLLIKPLDSAGGDGVRFCSTPDEVREVVSALWGKPHQMGHKVDSLVAQERLVGTEYVVNAVARNNRIAICEIWEILKETTSAGATIYDRGILQAPQNKVSENLAQYVSDVCAALEIRHGAVHAEIMLTSTGPVLIEVASRVAGAISHKTTLKAVGNSHAGRLVESISDPEAFSRLCKSGYTRHAYAAFVSLINRTGGRILSNSGLEKIRTVPSFVESIGVKSKGDMIEVTRCLFTGGGLIYLCHEDEAQLLGDIEKIRNWEREGFYELTS